MQIQSINSIIISVLILFFTACGGEESSDTLTSTASSTDTTTQPIVPVPDPDVPVSSTGPTIFDAGPVEGLKIICSLTELTTDVNGATNCEEDTFSIYLGEFKLGDINSIPTDGLIYTQDILNVTRAAIAYPEVTKLSMILQSLDKDANPLNGITLDANILDLLGSHLDTSTVIENLTFEDIENILTDVIGTALSQDPSLALKVVSYSTAQGNLATSIAGAPALTYEQRIAGRI